MLSNIASLFSTPLQRTFGAFALVTILCLFAGLATDMYFLAGVPVLLLFAYLAIIDFRKIFFILLGVLPLSMEVALPNGFATDLPSEGFMVVLMLIYFVYVLQNINRLSADFLKHPISLLLLLHLGWIFITTVTSDEFFVSLKYALAKVWYITVFYFMAGSLLKTQADFKKYFWWVFIPLALTITFILARFAAMGFKFEDVNDVMSPFYRNHVTYASIMVLFFPFVWFARFWYPKNSRMFNRLFFAVFFLLVGIQFSYTRTAYVALIAAMGAYYIFKFKLGKIAIIGSITLMLLGVNSLVQNNKFMDFTPDFEHTVTHHKFDNLIEATVKLEDISTMERVYRWVAGFYMADARPWMGFGPGNFYNFYRGYTVNSFRTYISDNIEKSGIHNYYLMVLVEQGSVGLVIFVLFAFYPFIRGERIYHESKDPNRKRMVMACLLCLIVIHCLLLMNDMIETDKVGPFFFISIALIVNADLANKRELREAKN